jgi:DNA polymerase-3 subunit beta
VKLELPREAAAAAATSAAKLVDEDSASDACRNTRLTGSPAGVEIYATDLVRSVRLFVAGRGPDAGIACVPAKGLAAALSALRTDRVTITVGPKAVVAGGECRVQLPVHPGEFFPVEPEPPATWVSLSARSVAWVLEKARVAVHQDEAVTHLAGVQLERAGRELRAFATNGRFFSFAATEVEPGPALTMLIPRAAFRAHGADLPFLFGDEGEIELGVSGSRLWVRTEGVTFSCAFAAAGEFPDWSRLRDARFPQVARAAREGLLAAARAVSAVTEGSDAILIDATPGHLVLAKAGKVGEARDAVDCEGEGPPFRVVVPATQALAALKRVEGEVVVVELMEGGGALRIRNPETDRLYYLLGAMADEAIPASLRGAA